MAKIVYGMNQSLDGYVNHWEMRTGPKMKALRYDPSQYDTYLQKTGIQYPT